MNWDATKLFSTGPSSRSFGVACLHVQRLEGGTMMKRIATVCGSLLLLIAGLCGCSDRCPLQLAQADRMVITNAIYPHFNCTIKGDEVKKVSKAVMAAKRDGKLYSAIFDMDVQFYSGTNCLETIGLAFNLFRTASGQYRDDTGELKAFNLRLSVAMHESLNDALDRQILKGPP
jgi:hypothetical protein